MEFRLYLCNPCRCRSLEPISISEVSCLPQAISSIFIWVARPIVERAHRSLVRQRPLLTSSGSHATLAQSMPSCTMDSGSAQARRDTTAFLPHRLRKKSSQPFQQQARDSIEPLRRRMHSPYSAERRPVNANYNRDQYPSEHIEIVQTSKASFQPTRKKALCVSPFRIYIHMSVTISWVDWHKLQRSGQGASWLCE